MGKSTSELPLASVKSESLLKTEGNLDPPSLGNRDDVTSWSSDDVTAGSEFASWLPRGTCVLRNEMK